MKLISFSENGDAIRPGALDETRGLITDLSAAGYADTLAVLTAGLTAPGASLPAFPLSAVRLHAPLTNPPRIFAIGLNYREHALETHMEFPKFPVVFFKLQTAIVGPGEAIVLPKETSEPDYEAELAVVIGAGGYRIPAEEAMQHVYGYTIVNDVSARDIQRSTSQWSMAKSLPTFCPMGPSIVTTDEIADPHALSIGTVIGEETLQDSNTRELIFRIPQLIEYLSSLAPLLPGDVISTGTPSGVGMGRKPQRWLRAGESVTVRIEGIGELKNPIVTE